MDSVLTPIPSVTKMTFDQAVRKMIDGKKIHRLEWGDRRIYYLLKDGLVSIHKAGEDEETTHPVILNDGDLLGTDWIVLSEAN